MQSRQKDEESGKGLAKLLAHRISRQMHSLNRFGDNFHFIFQPHRKPLLIARIVRSYLMYLCRGSTGTPLRNIDVALNYSCNMSCLHCSCNLMTKDAATLTEDEYSKIGKEARDLGVIYFSFTGGEPLLNDNLEDIIQHFSPRSCLIGLQTNAMLLNQQRVTSLYRAGVDVLQVSLDSFNPVEHDSLRNSRGAFQQTLRNVDLALANSINIIFSATITHSNLNSKGITDLLDYSSKRRIPVVVSIPCPVGKWSGRFDELLDDADRDYLVKLQQRYPRLRRDFDSNYMKMGCSAGSEKLYITPYGDVIPCPFIHISFGNVKHEPLKIIRSRMINYSRFGEYSDLCLAGEDEEFIRTIIIPTYKEKQLPMIWSNHPVLADIDNTGALK